MGKYINPPESTKEAWLSRHGIPITEDAAPDIFRSGDYLPVCLVDNGIFTAAAIGYEIGEVEEFSNPKDIRPRQWFKVSRDDLEPYMA